MRGPLSNLELLDTQLTSFACRIRLRSLQMINRARSSHIGSSFSMADLLAVLYSGIVRVDPKRPDWPGRDRFILSKGHACAARYVALADRGFFPDSVLRDLYRGGSRVAGHATRVCV